MTALEARKLAEDEIKAGKTPKYNDLRDWLEIVDSVGELKKIDGVDWNLEMGTLAELLSRESKGGVVPAVLFDNVPGGAGHTRRIGARLPDLIAAARDRVANCECGEETSCYNCLRSYGNQIWHEALSRGDAFRVLDRVAP